MLYSDENPDHSLLVPEGKGELLALLFPLSTCREQLHRAEQAENYAACAQWAKALDSGLPVIANAFQPLPAEHPLAGVPVTPDAALLADVSTPAELAFVLTQMAAYWNRSPEGRRFGFSVNHLTNGNDGYFFAAAVAGTGPDDQWLLAYEGRFTS